VFTLLETIYQAFDKLAKQHKVYKVESTGDQYIAVAGLPEATKNHALIMAKFAQACLREFEFLTRRLESTLGPDTSELGLSVGLHSGSVVGR
jgi:class 3 adenylate cyclase